MRGSRHFMSFSADMVVSHAFLSRIEKALLITTWSFRYGFPLLFS